MAFPTGWGRRAALTIDNTQVSGSGDHTDLPILWTVDNLPSEMFDADGSFPALAGGGDIRFSSDEAGSTQLSIDVDLFTIDNNPANGTALIWVKVPTVDFNDDTVIYVWYNKTGETQPAVTVVPGGRNDVWADYDFATHDGLTDVTGNGTITDTSTAADVGPFGNTAGARRASNSNNDYITSDQTFSTINEPFTLQTWGYIEAIAQTRLIGVGDASSTTPQTHVGTHFSGSEGGHARSNGSTADEAVTTALATQNVWRFYAGIFETDSSRKIDINGGAATGSNTTSVTVNNQDQLRMGASADSSPFGDQPVRFAEGRFIRSALSADRIATEFNNQDAPGTFASAGTPETPAGGPTGNPWYYYAQQKAA